MKRLPFASLGGVRPDASQAKLADVTTVGELEHAERD